MATGRKPKPTKLKVIDGNPSKRPINESEPQPKPTKPSCPAYLDPIAKKEWRRISAELHRLGLLTMIDREMLASYCAAYSIFRQAYAVVKEGGLTYEVTNEEGMVFIKRRPEVAIAKDFLQRAQSLAAEFGLSPSSRVRLDFSGQEGLDDEDFLFGATSSHTR